MRLIPKNEGETREQYCKRVITELTENEEFDSLDARHRVAAKLWDLNAQDAEKAGQSEEEAQEDQDMIFSTKMHIERAAGDSEDERKATFIASSETEDRHGDVVSQSGWDLKSFRKNPVLLFGHNSRDLPIGKVERIKIEDNKLIAETVGVEEGVHDLADKVWKMVSKGFLNAVSVGFRALEYEPRFGKDGEWLGFNFLKQELLELSIVPVPANPEAIRVARSFGAAKSEISELFTGSEACLDAIVQAEARARSIEMIKLRSGVTAQ
jgi:HK97 family phage prohead protease